MFDVSCDQQDSYPRSAAELQKPRGARRAWNSSALRNKLMCYLPSNIEVVVAEVVIAKLCLSYIVQQERS